MAASHCHSTTCVSLTAFVDSKFGSDRCGCLNSSVHPYRTLDAAIRAIPIGGVVYLRPGTYRGSEPLLNKNLYAETGVTIHVESPRLFDGALQVDGYADIVIDTPAPPGVHLALELYFRHDNQALRTVFRCNSINDLTSQNASIFVAISTHQTLIVEIKSRLTCSSVNKYGAIYVNTPTATITQTTITCPRIVNTVGGPIMTSYGNCGLYTHNLLTTGTAFVIQGGTNIIQTDDIGDETQPVAQAFLIPPPSSEVLLDIQTTFTAANLFATQGLTIGRGRNTFNIASLGTAVHPTQTGIIINADDGLNVFNIGRIFATGTAIDITTVATGAHNVLQIGAIGDPDTRVGTGLAVTNQAAVGAQSLITCQISSIQAQLAAVTVTGDGAGIVNVKGFIGSAVAVTTGIIADAPALNLNLNIAYLESNQVAIQANRGQVHLTINDVVAGSQGLSLGQSGMVALAINTATTGQEFVSLRGVTSSQIANVSLGLAISAGNGIWLEAGSGSTAQLAFELKSVQVAADFLTVTGSPLGLVSCLAYQVRAGGRGFRNTTITYCHLWCINLSTSFPGPTISLEGPAGSENTILGTIGNTGGPVLGVTQAVPQAIRLYSCTFFAPAGVGALQWPGPASLPQLVVLNGLTTTSPTFVTGTSPATIIPTGAAILSGDIGPAR